MPMKCDICKITNISENVEFRLISTTKSFLCVILNHMMGIILYYRRGNQTDRTRRT